MKPQILSALCAVFLSSMPVFADDSPLAKQMEALDDSYKAFRKTEDAAQGAVMAREAQKHVAQGLGHVPEMLAKMAQGPARAKAEASYRLQMGQLYVKLCEVEQAFLDNKLEKVAELVNDIKEMKKKGHNEFMEDEE